MQEMFNKDLEEIKKSQSIMNNVITEIKNTLEGKDERLLLTHVKMLGFLASGRGEFNPGSEMRLDRSELLCNRILLKYKRYRESF